MARRDRGSKEPIPKFAADDDEPEILVVSGEEGEPFIEEDTEMVEMATEKKRHATVERYAYRDEEGKLMGRAEVKYGPQQERMLRMANGPDRIVSGREIFSVTFQPVEKSGGKQKPFDLIKSFDLDFVTIFAASERMDNYYFDQDSNLALVPEPKTPLEIGIIGHELGHAEQFIDAQTKDVYPLYGLSERVAAKIEQAGFFPVTWMADFKKAVEVMPELEHSADDQVRDLLRLERHIERLAAEAEKAKSVIASDGREQGKILERFLEDNAAGQFEKLFSEYFSMPRVPGSTKREGTLQAKELLIVSCEKQGVAMTDELQAMIMDDPKSVMDELLTLRNGGGLDWVVRQSESGGVEMSKMIGPEDGQTELSVEVKADDLSSELFERTYDYVDERRRSNVGKLEKITDQIEQATMEQDDAPMPDQQRFLELLRVPKKILEFDASQRIVLKLVELREATGVDLFRSHGVRKEATLEFEAEDCVESVEGQVATADLGKKVVAKKIVDWLQDALTSYKLKRTDLIPARFLKKRGGTMPGKSG